MISGDVQYVSQSTSKYSHEDTIKLAIEGGCRWIQLRMKDEPKEEVLNTALKVQQEILCLTEFAHTSMNFQMLLTASIIQQRFCQSLTKRRRADTSHFSA